MVRVDFADDEAKAGGGEKFLFPAPVLAGVNGMNERAVAGARRKRILTSNHWIAELFSFMCFDYKEAKINIIAFVLLFVGEEKCLVEESTVSLSPTLPRIGKGEFPHHDGVNYHMK